MTMQEAKMRKALRYVQQCNPYPDLSYDKYRIAFELVEPVIAEALTEDVASPTEELVAELRLQNAQLRSLVAELTNSMHRNMLRSDSIMSNLIGK